MSPHLYRLDPRLPVVWQNPNALQVGIDPPAVVLQDVDDRVLPLLHALGTGMTGSGLAMLARENKLEDSERTRLLDALAPALEHREENTLVSFVLDSPRVDSTALVAVWRGIGHPVHECDSREHAPPGEVIVVADYVVEPEHHHAWLRLDRSHTPMVFLDQSVIIGPRVEPGVGACLHCVRISRQRATAHQVALDSQLWGKPAPTGTPELRALAAWHCLQLLHTGGPGEVRRLDALTRSISTSWVAREPECSCWGLD